MKAVLDVAASKVGKLPHAREAFGAASDFWQGFDTTGAGKCLKCHTLDSGDDGSMRINWSPATADPSSRPITKFRHSSHIRLPEMIRENDMQVNASCASCHQLETSPDNVGAYRELFSAENHNPHQFRSGFQQLMLNNCAECHTENRAGDSCLQCHQYHATPSPLTPAIGSLIISKKTPADESPSESGGDSASDTDTGESDLLIPDSGESDLLVPDAGGEDGGDLLVPDSDGGDLLIPDASTEDEGDLLVPDPGGEEMEGDSLIPDDSGDGESLIPGEEAGESLIPSPEEPASDGEGDGDSLLPGGEAGEEGESLVPEEEAGESLTPSPEEPASDREGDGDSLLPGGEPEEPGESLVPNQNRSSRRRTSKEKSYESIGPVCEMPRDRRHRLRLWRPWRGERRLHDVAGEIGIDPLHPDTT